MKIMTQKLHIIVRLLVFWAFLGGIIAPACGFMWGGKYSVIEICTAKGIENRVVMNEGEHNSPTSTMADQCQFCFSSANLTALIIPAPVIEKITYSVEKLRFQHYQNNVLVRYQSNISPRGPPSFV